MKKLFLGTLALAILFSLSQFLANRRVDGWNCALETDAGDATNLVVVVHGWMSFRDGLTDLPPAIYSAYEDSDETVSIAVCEWDDSFFSNASPVRLAEKLSADIETLVKAHRFDEVTLVGHSTGALFVRRAYLYARGTGADASNEALPVRTWHEKLDRIVLLAGMNRGWETDDNLLYNSVLRLVRWTGHAGLVFDTRRGSPFIGNLRIEWLRESRADANAPMPLVVQLLAENDDLIDIDQEKDLIVTGDFVFLEVAGADHMTIVDLDGARSPAVGQTRKLFDSVFRPERWAASDADYEARRETFSAALTKPRSALLRVQSVVDRLDVGIEEKVSKVVFVAHGIRDYGHWTSDYIVEIEEADPTYRGHPLSYQRFPMVSFMFGDRKKNVRMFVDEYVEQLARFPNADFSYIGHSNGTYILASALSDYRAVGFTNVYFAGSVVSRVFDWNAYRLSDRVNAVRNDTAAGDWIVAYFPGFFEKMREIALLKWVSRNNILGNAGYANFTSSSVVQNGYKFAGGHSAALRSDLNRSSAVAFALYGEPGREVYLETKAALSKAGLLTAKETGAIKWLANYPFIVWGGILIGLLLVWRIYVGLFLRWRPGNDKIAHASYLLIVYILANSF